MIATLARSVLTHLPVSRLAPTRMSSFPAHATRPRSSGISAAARQFKPLLVMSQTSTPFRELFFFERYFIVPINVVSASSLMVTHLPPALTMPRADSLTSEPIGSSTPLHMIISSAELPPSLSPSRAVYYLVDMMTGHVTSGTRSRVNVWAFSLATRTASRALVSAQTASRCVRALGITP